MSLWRRLFAQKNQDEELALEVLCDVFGIDAKRIRPCSEESNCQLLGEFTRDGHRANAGQALHCSNNVMSNILAPPRVQPQESNTGINQETVSQLRRQAQQVHSPNLSIPDGDDSYLTRAQ